MVAKKVPTYRFFTLYCLFLTFFYTGELCNCRFFCMLVGMMGKMMVWTRAARPKTLLAGISPALLGSVLAMRSGAFDWFLFGVTVVTALLLQIGANLTNDYSDFVRGADNSNRKGQMRMTGAVSPATMKKAAYLTLLISGVTGSYLIFKGGILIACMMPLAIFFALIYTAGPFPLAYLGLGDLAVFLLFGPLAVGSTFFLQRGYFSKESLILGTGIGLLAAAILMVNNVRDVEEDRAANKRTLVVRFGVIFGKSLYVFEVFGAAIIPLLVRKDNPLLLTAPLILIPGLLLIKSLLHYRDPRELNLVLENTAKLLLVYTLLLCAALLL